jgi:hypothetical protein
LFNVYKRTAMGPPVKLVLALAILLVEVSRFQPAGTSARADPQDILLLDDVIELNLFLAVLCNLI